MSPLAHWTLLRALLLSLLLTVHAGAAEHGRWIGTWAASPFGFQPFDPGPPPESFVNQTVRHKLRISVGGQRLRIRLSNELGTTPLAIGAATVALASTDAEIQTASLRALTFGGETSVTIPPGAPMLSDPVDLVVPDLAELAVSLYLPEENAPATLHMARTAYVSSAGDFTRAPNLNGAQLTTNLVYLTGVYVDTDADVAVVATFGDSITDGDGSTPHSYNSWPDQLAVRASKRTGGGKIAVVNTAISGNQILRDGAGSSALARFDRDVLSTPGLTHVVVLEGINDIGTGGSIFPGNDGPPQRERSAADLIAAYRQLIARAHVNGVKIYGGTLTPFEGSFPGYYTPAREKVRSEVNEWIRSSGEFDGVIDFDAAIRDPANPRAIKAEYDSGDTLHPGDAGYRRMADAIDLALFP
jgi:lysophospholipase L1-like esterase